MSAILRALSALAYSLLAVLSGCSPPIIAPLYGPAPVEHDPSVEITDFSYTPASSIQLGESLTFSGKTNQQINQWDCAFIVTVGSQQSPVSGWTSGIAEYAIEPASEQGRSTGRDDQWTGDLVWYPEYGLGQDLPVSAHLEWSDGYQTEPVMTAPLTVLPAVE